MGCPKLTYFTTVPRLYNAAKRGNILSKTDAGTLQYDEPSHPYQVTGQTDYPSSLNTDPQIIDYTSGDRPLTIKQSGATATFSYNHAGQRTKMIMSGASNYTRIYLGGNYECEIRATASKLFCP